MLILYILLLLTSLVCYGTLIVVSIMASHWQITFVYGLMFYVIATFVHVFAPLILDFPDRFCGW